MRTRYDTVLLPFIFIVGCPGRPVIPVPDTGTNANVPPERTTGRGTNAWVVLHRDTQMHTFKLLWSGMTQTRPQPFLSSSRGASFFILGYQDAAPNAPEHRENTKIFHLMCHQVAILMRHLMQNFLENYGCGCVWAFKLRALGHTDNPLGGKNTKRRKKRKNKIFMDCPGFWGGSCLCIFSPMRNYPTTKKEHTTKKCSPTQTRDNPTNMFMFMC